jgi:hypothetical protein
MKKVFKYNDHDGNPQAVVTRFIIRLEKDWSVPDDNGMVTIHLTDGSSVRSCESLRTLQARLDFYLGDEV